LKELISANENNPKKGEYQKNGNKIIRWNVRQGSKGGKEKGKGKGRRKREKGKEGRWEKGKRKGEGKEKGRRERKREKGERPLKVLLPNHDIPPSLLIHIIMNRHDQVGILLLKALILPLAAEGVEKHLRGGVEPRVTVGAPFWDVGSDAIG